jgi:hypothetical protein
MVGGWLSAARICAGVVVVDMTEARQLGLFARSCAENRPATDSRQSGKRIPPGAIQRGSSCGLANQHQRVALLAKLRSPARWLLPLLHPPPAAFFRLLRFELGLDLRSASGATVFGLPGHAVVSAAWMTISFISGGSPRREQNMTDWPVSGSQSNVRDTNPE